MLALNLMSKEALHVTNCSPPRLPNRPRASATVVPLEQLWARLPSTQRQELLGQLTRILARQLAPPIRREAADE